VKKSRRQVIENKLGYEFDVDSMSKTTAISELDKEVRRLARKDSCERQKSK